MYNVVIHKNGEDLKNEGFCYHNQCRRDFDHVVHNVKRSKKRQQNSEEIEYEVPPSRKLRSAMETFDSNQCLFCQCISEERSHHIIQDSKDLELKKAFRECPSSLEVFKIRSLGAEDATGIPSKVLKQNNFETYSRGIICINHTIFNRTGIFKIIYIDAKQLR